MESGSASTGTDMATCALALCYAYREPKVPPSHLCSRLLSHTARLVLSATQRPYANLEAFIADLRNSLSKVPSTSSTLAILDQDALTDQLCETIRLLLVDAATQPAAFHAFFQRVGRVLFRHEEEEEHDAESDDDEDEAEEPVDEDGNPIPKRPRHIDAKSPLGRFFSKMYAKYSNADEASIVRAAANLEVWINVQTNQLHSHPSHLDNEKPAAVRYRLAMLRGDYTTARAVREGSLDQAPGEYDARLHHTLLADAEFFLDTKAFEMARNSLNEALHVARASRDVGFLATCDRMMRRIECEEELYQRGDLSAPTSNPGLSSVGRRVMEDRPARLDVWDLQRTIDQGQSRAKVIATLQEGSLQQAQGSIDGSQRSLLLAQMWTEMGIHEAAAASTKDASRHLSFALQRSWQLAEAGDYDSAILLLLNHELIDHLNFPSYQRWYPGIWRIVYLQARRVGRFKAMSSICRAYPDAARDVDGQQSVDIRDKAGAARDEAMHGRRVLSTFKEELLGQLRSATEGFGRVGQRRRAIAIVEEVEKRAERAQLFEVHRMARVARAQLLLSACQDCVEDEDDGTADEIADYEEMDGAVGGAAESREEEAREIMESILPQCLMDVNVERRGQAEWVYAQSILAQTRRRARREAATEEKTREDLQEGMRWLQKSDEDFEKAGMPRQRVGVLSAIVALRRSHSEQHTFDQQEDDVARRLDEVELHADEVENAPYFEPIDARVEQIKRLVGLVGAKVVAGA